LNFAVISGPQGVKGGLGERAKKRQSPGREQSLCDKLRKEKGTAKVPWGRGWEEFVVGS